MEKIQTPKTAGTPGFITIKAEEEEKLDLEGQRIYQSGIDTLLYLLKHSHPDLSNVVHELSKSLDGVNMAWYKEMLHVCNRILSKVHNPSGLVLM